MKNKLLNILTLIMLSCISAFCLTACNFGGGNPSSEPSTLTIEQIKKHKDYVSEEDGSEGLKFKLLDNGNYMVSAGTFDGATLKIPSLHNGRRVETIGTFSRLNNLTSVKIGYGVTSLGILKSYNVNIGNSIQPFFVCKALTEVYIPDSVTTICDNSFIGCTSLANVELPDSITYIGVRVFNGTDYYNNESNWKDGALYANNHLLCVKNSIAGEYVIKEGTKCIASSAFSGCTSLTSVKIPNSVIGIGDVAFGSCTSLTSIEIPNSVTRIGQEAFSNTAYYNNESNWVNDVLYIDNHLIAAKYTISGNYSVKAGTLTIAGGGFYCCRDLTSVTLPKSLINIENFAFQGCENLTNVAMNNGVRNIGIGAFSGCVKIENITLSNALLSIGELAFIGCYSLTSISIDNKNANYKSIDGNLYSKDGKVLIKYASGKNNTSFKIPNTVTTISANAVRDSASLENLTIPNSVEFIGECAFDGCSSLETIKFNGTNSEWNKITKVYGWNFNVPATKVICTDGEVNL